MSNTVFNRYEQKFMVNHEAYEMLTEQLRQYTVPDEHSRDGGFYSICNIYYDTDDDYLIRKSVESPVYKEKLRLRAYGRPDEDSEAFIEIKKKFKGNVNKRRIILPLHEAVDYLDRDILPDSIDSNSQIFREIDYMKRMRRLVPKVYIFYNRRAFYGIEDSDLRITFDTDILARRTDLNLMSQPKGRPILKEGYHLMEIKVSKAVPLWLSDLLSEHGLYKTSFSKYGTEYMAYLQNIIKKGDRVICLNQSSQQVKPQYQQALQ
ncbi:MAG: polyphosphate polymerase domain-containing protein [Butyrivibrio sp.]